MKEILAAQDLAKKEAFGKMDVDEARQFIELAEQLVPLIATGRSVEASISILQDRLNDLAAYGRALAQSKPSPIREDEEKNG